MEKILLLAQEAAKGKDNAKESAVGSNGYGFIFANIDNEKSSFSNIYSHKYSEVGSLRFITKKLDKKGILKYDILKDLHLVGSLNTLLPTIQFGGIEKLFDVWMLVLTPENRVFPATLYWRKSGLSVGGWLSYDKDVKFPKGLLDLVNFTPFEFKDDEKGMFLDALEFALKKVPVSDFWGVYNYGSGNTLMGVKRGESFIKELGIFERNLKAEGEIKPLIGVKMEGGYDEPFTIKLLPGMRIYVAEFEYDTDQDDLLFGNAKDILDFCKSQKKI